MFYCIVIFFICKPLGLLCMKGAKNENWNHCFKTYIYWSACIPSVLEGVVLFFILS